MHISETEHPVPTQFSGKDKWDKGNISMESTGILVRSYMNMKYPTFDPFEADRVNRYLKISFAHPGM